MELLARGVITPEEAAVHPYRNLVTRVVGGKSGPEADFATLEVQMNDRFLLCSDGLTHVLDDGEIRGLVEVSSPLEAVCDKLVQKTLDGGAPDNVTVVIMEVSALDPESPKSPLTLSS
jgi:protein phosphatase